MARGRRRNGKRGDRDGQAVPPGPCEAGAALIADAEVLQIDHLVVGGHERLSTGEVLALVDGLRGQNILTVSLDAWQQRLRSSPWVDAATSPSTASELRNFVISGAPISAGWRLPWKNMKRRIHAK